MRNALLGHPPNEIPFLLPGLPGRPLPSPIRYPRLRFEFFRQLGNRLGKHKRHRNLVARDLFGAFFLVLPKGCFHLASTRVRNLAKPAVKPLLLPAIYSSRLLLSIAFCNISRDEETLGLSNDDSVQSGVYKTPQPLLDLCQGLLYKQRKGLNSLIRFMDTNLWLYLSYKEGSNERC